MIGLVKNTLYKTVDKSKLELHELAKFLTDTETSLNNRPLTYIEEDTEFPVLPPNSLVLGQQLIIPNEDIKDKDLRKGQKYIQKCKEASWKRWRSEYLISLRERHNLKHRKKESDVKVGEVVVIKGEARNRAQWNIRTITDVYPGKDGKLRAVKLRAGKFYLERVVKHLYPLEISCDIIPSTKEPTMNVNAEEFQPRRTAFEIAQIRITELANDEMEEPLNE